MRVLVTGATGFLGSRVVDMLLEQSITVRALVRETSDTWKLEEQKVELAVGDLELAKGLKEAVTDVDAVLHCAGGGRVLSVRDYYSNNLDTTRNLLDVIRVVRPQLKRFVLVSSLAAHGPSPGGTARAADDPSEPVSHYGQSKVAAEALTMRCSELFPVTVVRPPSIYGPGDTRLLALFQSAARGTVALPWKLKALSLIHVDDCARALCAALTREHPSGRSYFVEDGQVQQVPELVQALGRAVGKKPRLIRIPKFVLFIAACFSELWAAIIQRPSILTRDKVRDMTQEYWICDSTDIRRDLDWASSIDFETGAAETVAWYRSRRWLP